MAKRTRIRVKEDKKINIFDIKDGVYIDEKSFGTVKKMTLNEKCIFGIEEYMYSGKIHRGRIAFLAGHMLEQPAPILGDYNHGFTLEGAAQEIFKVEKSLTIYSAYEHRTFCYVNPNSDLKFIGDPNKNYDVYIRIYDNAYGIENYRWVVIYAEESK